MNVLSLNFRRRRWQFAFVTAMMLAFGCGSNPTPLSSPSGQTAAVDVSPKIASTSARPAISDEECLAFAKQFEGAMLVDDGIGADSLLDWSRLIDKVLEGLALAKDPEEFIEEMRATGLRGKANLLKAFGSQLTQGGSYKFIRIREESDEKRVLF